MKIIAKQVLNNSLKGEVVAGDKKYPFTLDLETGQCKVTAGQLERLSKDSWKRAMKQLLPNKVISFVTE